jgi:hypothetical protein
MARVCPPAEDRKTSTFAKEWGTKQGGSGGAREAPRPPLLPGFQNSTVAEVLKVRGKP